MQLDDRQNKFNTFDYSTIQGIPEQMLRVALLEERLRQSRSGPDATVLEVGIGTGDITVMLRSRFNSVTCVDCSNDTIERMRALISSYKGGDVTIVQERIEEADLPVSYYDHIVLLNMLEHLEEPVMVLKRLLGCVASGGLLHVTVPLANSLHRWLGVKLGMISDVNEVAESDIRFGHYRVYSPELLCDHLESAGWRIVHKLPFYLKPLPTADLTPLSSELHKALFELGQQFPQFASYIYVEATPR